MLRMRLPATLLSIGFMLAISGSAAVIHEIKVLSGTSQEISADMVRANMTLVKGGEFSQEQLSNDIKKLYGTRQFDDIGAKVTSAGPNQVDITLTIVPKARINSIVFTGNERFSTSRLMRVLKQKVNAIQDDRLLAEDVEGLQDFYRSKGYSDTRVQQQVVPLEASGDIQIAYEITESPRYKVRSVEFIGNSGTVFSDRQLKNGMQTEVSFWGRIFPTGYFSQSEFDTDLDELRLRYLDRGYLDFKVDKVDKQVSADDSIVWLTIFLAEGDLYTVTDVSISGNERFGTGELTDLLRLKTGVVYNQGTERDDVNALVAKYNRNGYLDCRVFADRKADSSTHSVTINYVIREGESSRIRNVMITGNRVTKDHVIRREMRIHPGDLSDESKLRASRASLMNLGYFEEVNIIPLSTSDPAAKDLNVKVTEKLTGQVVFGAGISSADSVLGTVEIAQTNFDLNNPPSFRGGGQRFRLKAQAGSSNQEYLISFTEPWLFDRPLRLDTDIWRREVSSNRNYDQESVGGSVSLTRRMKSPFWRQSLGYRIESVRISDFDSDFTQSIVDFEEGSHTVSALSLGFERDHRDNVRVTNSGSRVALRSELHGEFLGSYATLYKLTLSGDKYWPIFRKSVFKLSGQIDQLDSVSGDEPRIFDRWFAGGIGTIRGFKERDVGPIDPRNEEPIGGQSRLLASAEFRTPIIKKTVYLLLFSDVGNVWADEADWDVSELNVGAGAGLRLFLPIGVISLDYGWPVNREQRHLSTGGRLHFNLGATF